MSRGWRLPICVLIACSALSYAQQPPAPAASDAQQIDPSQLPPDEDKASQKDAPIVFNPVTSKHDVVVGDEYFKKGNFRAAAARYRDATKSNDGNAEAWLRLGDAEDRMHDAKAAREAWEKYLQLAPEDKRAEEVKKKLAKLKS